MLRVQIAKNLSCFDIFRSFLAFLWFISPTFQEEQWLRMREKWTRKLFFFFFLFLLFFRENIFFQTKQIFVFGSKFLKMKKSQMSLWDFERNLLFLYFILFHLGVQKIADQKEKRKFSLCLLIWWYPVYRQIELKNIFSTRKTKLI